MTGAPAERRQPRPAALRSVSHELRAPVNSVLGLARLLLDVEATGPR
ncbi:hypothetical protein [Frankia sp. ACN1ag]|nr:hypothetical protein [Frankia sp. ACN1ag]